MQAGKKCPHYCQELSKIIRYTPRISSTYPTSHLNFSHFILQFFRITKKISQHTNYSPQNHPSYNREPFEFCDYAVLFMHAFISSLLYQFQMHEISTSFSIVYIWLYRGIIHLGVIHAFAWRNKQNTQSKLIIKSITSFI